ncbi:MAG: hypothetical protein JXR64_08270 [Spirochaetales bacterium]|nr:hypothetical protein [Spirochaetales bacterium]
MEYRLATYNDIDNVLELHKKYHIDTIKPEDKADGFITTLLNTELLKELIDQDGLVIAINNKLVVGFVMSASWEYCSKWPMFQYMIGKLGELEYLGQKLTTYNSYQYGPVCIDKKFRGTGVLEGLFEYARIIMNRKYPILVTFVNKMNPRSVSAHTKKLKLDIITEFEYNNKSYLELVYDTSKEFKNS